MTSSLCAVADIYFPSFDANSTLDYGAYDKRSSVAHLGATQGEGSYGLVLLGSASVRTCLSHLLDVPR